MNGKKKAFVSAGIALLMGLGIPMVAKAETVSASQMDAELWLAGKQYHTNEKVPVFWYQGDHFVSIRYVAEHLGATVTWDNAAQTVQISTLDRPAKSSIWRPAWSPFAKSPSGDMEVSTVDGAHFVSNGQEKKVSTVLCFQGHYYLPASFVADMLGGVLQVDDSYTTSFYYNVAPAPSNTLLRSFVTDHPKAYVVQMKPVQWTPNGDNQMAIITHEGFGSNVYFRAADQKETKLHVEFDKPERIDTVTQANQNFVILTGAGGETTYLDVYGMENGVPVKLDNFSGVSGCLSWLQDGKLEILDMNPTYRFDIVASDGSKRDSIQKDLYEFHAATHQFDSLGEYINGTQPKGTSTPIEPRRLAVILERELRDVDSAIGSFQYEEYWTQSAKDSIVAHKDALSFLQGDDTPLSLTSVKEDSAEAIYSYQKDGHELQMTLTNNNGWQVTGITVDGK